MGERVIMSREIFFKAKRKDNGEWVEGYYIYHIKRTICPIGDSVKPEDEQHVIMRDGFSDWNMPRDTVVYEINPDTLCQYTGLTGKYGKKIWENDLLGHKLNRVEFLNGTYCINGDRSLFFEANTNEVIGNIFDNQEMLEVE